MGIIAKLDTGNTASMIAKTEKTIAKMVDIFFIYLIF